jgi:SAM-dependent methyltransferase
MMFGTRERFDYLECGRCGTVQLLEIPDLSRHYPPEYLSFDESRPIDLSTTLGRRIGARLAGMHLIKGRGLLGKLVLAAKPWIAAHFPDSLRDPLLRLRFDSRILDYGCGNGHLLRTLRYFGFSRLTGADAFIEGDLVYPGVTIYRRHLAELAPAFDLIMLHHSFEHLPEPAAALRELSRLVANGGHVLIRMPIVSHAWERYGADWVQLDPPRHLFLYTERAFRELCQANGLEVVKVVYDSTSFQFWGSEQYRLDIPLNDPRSLNRPESESVFTAGQIEDWDARAIKLNAASEGDQACFYLRKSSVATA